VLRLRNVLNLLPLSPPQPNNPPHHIIPPFLTLYHNITNTYIHPNLYTISPQPTQTPHPHPPQHPPPPPPPPPPTPPTEPPPPPHPPPHPPTPISNPQPPTPHQTHPPPPQPPPPTTHHPPPNPTPTPHPTHPPPPPPPHTPTPHPTTHTPAGQAQPAKARYNRDTESRISSAGPTIQWPGNPAPGPHYPIERETNRPTCESPHSTTTPTGPPAPRPLF
jgi:hypothetical protein